MEKQEENGHFCSMGMLRKVGTGEEGQVSSGKAARRCDALIFACITRGLGVLERSWLKWEELVGTSARKLEMRHKERLPAQEHRQTEPGDFRALGRGVGDPGGGWGS